VPSVTLHSVGRHFAEVKAVDSIDLSIEHGEFVTVEPPINFCCSLHTWARQ
jgi:iron(III) transport system ATP-binding protein